jgi:hypothetical protein
MLRDILANRRMAWAALAFCLTGTAVGCGKGGSPDLTPVAGVVTLDGQPLADARLTFHLANNFVPGYSSLTAKTDPEGKYQLTSQGKPGALPGVFKVAISRVTGSSGAAMNPDEGMDMQQLAMQGRAKESLPVKYSDLDQTELSVTVEKGKTDGYDFQLRGS